MIRRELLKCGCEQIHLATTTFKAQLNTIELLRGEEKEQKKSHLTGVKVMNA